QVERGTETRREQTPGSGFDARETAGTTELSLHLRRFGNERVKRVEPHTRVHGQSFARPPGILKIGAAFVQAALRRHRNVVSENLIRLMRHAGGRLENQSVIAVKSIVRVLRARTHDVDIEASFELVSAGECFFRSVRYRAGRFEIAARPPNLQRLG